jgi:hypothetical protein
MHELIKQAEALVSRYKFEIERPFDRFSFFKAKFQNDQQFIKLVCSNLYKKLK